MRHCTCKGRYTDEISCGTRPFRKAGKRLVHQLGRGLGGAPRSVRGARRAVPQREGVSCGRPLVAVRRRAHGKRHVRHGRPRETRHAWPPEGGSPGLAAAHAPVVAPAPNRGRCCGQASPPRTCRCGAADWACRATAWGRERAPQAPWRICGSTAGFGCEKGLRSCSRAAGTVCSRRSSAFLPVGARARPDVPRLVCGPAVPCRCRRRIDA